MTTALSRAAYNLSREASSYSARGALTRFSSNTTLPPSIITKSSDLAIKAVRGAFPETIIRSRTSVEDAIREVAKDFGDKRFHVVDLSKVIARYIVWQTNFPGVVPYFSVKTNPDKIVLATLASLGAGFDCCTIEEIRLVMELGVSPSRIIFANPRKSTESISEALDKGVSRLVVDDLNETKKIRSVRSSTTPELLIRTITDDEDSGTPLSSKFGATPEESREIIDYSSAKDVRISGIAFHVGSNNRNAYAYTGAIAEAAKLYSYASIRWGLSMKTLDIGGGWPGDGDKGFSETAEIVRTAISKRFDSSVEVVGEPGRFLVMDSTTLVSRVIGVRERKRSAIRELFITNGVYGPFISSLYFGHDQKKALAEGWKFSHLKSGTSDTVQTRLWGPTPDSGDKVIDRIHLPSDLGEGDFILTKNMGSYGPTAYECNFSQVTPSTPVYIASDL